MANFIIEVPAVSIGSLSLSAGSAHIGSVTLDTQGGNTGSAVTAGVVYNGGRNASGNFVGQQLTTNGEVINANTQIDGSAISTVGMAVGGTDGTNYQHLNLDTSGNLKVIGVAAQGVAIPTGLVPIAGSDGVLARALLCTTLGQLAIAGGGNIASAVPTAALAMGGTDGTNLRMLAVSSAGVASVIATAGEAHVGEVGGKTVLVSTNFARPADTTTYAASDAVSNSTSAPTILSFTGAARVSAGSGYITKARLTKSTTTTAAASFRLWLLHTSITALNDNAAYTLLYANRDKRIGYIDFTCSTEGTGSDCAEAQEVDKRIAFTLPSGTTMYGLLEVKAAYAPGNAETFHIELQIEQN